MNACILLSTYNGESFLEEQIRSVLCQLDIDVTLFVRDDGSTDRTIELLDQFASQDKRIRIMKDGMHLGPAMSFLKLLREAPSSDIYAFCDQDDVWNTGKLSKASRLISYVEGPALYISEYRYIDENSNSLGEANAFTNPKRPLRLQETLVYRAPLGCVMVLNQPLRNLIASGFPKSIRMHDHWSMLIAEAFHCPVIVDTEPMVNYRLHSNNVVGAKKDCLTRYKRLWRSAVFGSHERWSQAVSLLECYGDEMPADSRRVVSCVVDYRKSIEGRCRLLKDKSFRTGDRRIDTLFVLSVMLGLF